MPTARVAPCVATPRARLRTCRVRARR